MLIPAVLTPEAVSATVAKYGDTIGDGKHLVQLVADKDDGVTAGNHALEGGDELLDFLRREHGGRLVKDQHAGAAIKHLEDFDPLLFANAKLPDLRLRIDPQPVLLLQSQDLLVELGHVENEAGRREAEDDILGNSLRGDKHEVLVHHTQPGCNCVAWGAKD